MAGAESSRVANDSRNGPAEGAGTVVQQLGVDSLDQRCFHCDGLAPTPTDEPTSIKLSILMAAYNEEQTILRAVHGVLQVPFPCEVELIVVDDGSTDKTSGLLEAVDDPRITVHRHGRNQGKGASLLTAMSIATGTHVVPLDADLEYAPEDIPRMLGPVLAGRCDVVYGVRLFGFNTVYHSYKYALGNRVLTSITNILYNSYISDLHTCLKLIPLAVLRRMKLSERRFGLDTQVTAFLLREGIRPFEVPVSYYSRSHAQGKKINWRDAVKCVWILFKSRVGRVHHGESEGMAMEICRPTTTQLS